MFCKKCNKFVAVPLELYTGAFACPSCHRISTVEDIAVQVTSENEDEFMISELCFARMLKASKDDEYKTLRDSAIEHCRTAAMLGNPKALVRLGFFYEKGYITSDSRERVKLAGDYYKLVWNREGISSDEKTKDAVDGDKIRNIAAARHLNMLERLGGKGRKKEYSEVKEAVAARGLSVAVGGSAVRRSEDIAENIADILSSCTSDERPPLFGIFRADGETLGALCIPPEGKKTSRLYDLAVSKRRELVLFNSAQGGMKTLKSQADLDSVAGDGAGDRFLFFFNDAGKHSVSRRVCSKIGKALRKTRKAVQYAYVRSIIDVFQQLDRRDWVFTEDDVSVYHDWWETYDKSTGDLIDSIINGIDKR